MKQGRGGAQAIGAALEQLRLRAARWREAEEDAALHLVPQATPFFFLNDIY